MWSKALLTHPSALCEITSESRAPNHLMLCSKQFQSQWRQRYRCQRCCHMMNMCNCLQLTASQAVLQPCVLYCQDHWQPLVSCHFAQSYNTVLASAYFSIIRNRCWHMKYHLTFLSQTIDVSFPQNVTVTVLFPYLPCEKSWNTFHLAEKGSLAFNQSSINLISPGIFARQLSTLINGYTVHVTLNANAQLSQKDRTTGYVLVSAKSGRLELKDIILRRSICHCDIIGLKICRIRWKNAK